MTLASVLLGAFVAAVVAANVVAGKVLEVGPLLVPAGVLAYPLTFLVTDVIGEVEGRAAARRVVHAGTVGLVVGAVTCAVAAALPGLDATAYDEVLAFVPRVAIASVLAYLVAQHVDVTLFHWLRRLTKGRHLWLRNNGSTVVSQLLDSTVFVAIAFAGRVSWSTLLALVLGQYLVKTCIAVLDTPACYVLVAWMRRHDGKTTVTITRTS